MKQDRRRCRWLLAPLGLALLAGVGGCAVTPRPAATPPEPIILDYRNGWWHRADGSQTLEAIGRLYGRNGDLVARLNDGPPDHAPPRGRMIYVPPSNDMALVREALTRVQGRPDLVPDTPWNHKPPDPPRKRAHIEAGPSLKSYPDKPSPAAVASARPATAAADRRAPPRRRPIATAPARDGFLWPVRGEIVARFKEGWNNACHGIEIAAAAGAPVVASRPGRVLLAQRFPGYGNMVLIDHGDGYASVYGYNSELLVREDQTVGAGDRIASVGRPSSGTQSRLFFQIRRNAQPVDPLRYLVQ